MSQRASDLDGFFGYKTKDKKSEVRFGMCNVRNLYRVGLFMTVAKKMSKCKLDLVGVQEVRCNRSGNELRDKYTLSMERGMKIMN
jgi:hypothetical protein